MGDLNIFGITFEFEKQDGGWVLVKKETVRPRCWLDWENTTDYEDEEEDDGPVRPRCWLEEDEE